MRRVKVARQTGALLVILGLASVAIPAPAAAQDSLLRSIARSAGLVADPAPPADFVLTSRPAADEPPIPVFKTPEEPPSKVMSKAELKAMDADLDSAGKRHDKIRAAFPPAAKAEAEAARKAKAGKRRPSEAAAHIN
jgi:hypothetical protein